MQLIDSLVGYAVGAPHWDATRKKFVATIIKTLDGGVKCHVQKTGVTETLRGISFVNATNGWAVGTGGTILHTTDGGDTWQAQTIATTAEFRAVYFTDVNNGWAVGESGAIIMFSSTP